jgi:hypothetical protein
MEQQIFDLLVLRKSGITKALLLGQRSSASFEGVRHALTLFA